MISKDTLTRIKEQIKDWSRNNIHTLQDLRVLMRRIRPLKGNKSFHDSVKAIEDLIDELIEDLEETES